MKSLDVREETPRGRGAVSVVSVRGHGALARVSRLCARASLPIGVPKLVRLSAEGDDLDEVLVCALDDTHVEIHLHGSPVLVRALMRAIGSAATDVATEAVSADTVAAPEERARALLAHAPCESAARILLDQAEGAWRSALERIAMDVAVENVDGMRVDAENELERLVRASHDARFALVPARVILAGPVNAGKSTLFNVLAGERRALTSAEPGTTRDLLRATVLLGASAIELFDTAGERENVSAEPAARIERAGQERARAERARADLVVWLTDVSAPPSAAPEGALHVWTCADRASSARLPAVSALRDPSGARATFADLVRERLRLPEHPWISARACAFDEISRTVLWELVEARAKGGAAEISRRARALLAADSL